LDLRRLVRGHAGTEDGDRGHSKLTQSEHIHDPLDHEQAVWVASSTDAQPGFI